MRRCTEALDLDRVLVTGGRGYVGRALSFGYRPSRAECDITDPASVAAAMDICAPQAVLHLACVDVRRSEEDPAAAWETNVGGTANVAAEARRRGIAMIYVSSSTLFSGEPGTRFDEAAEPAPPNHYARTKWIGEGLVAGMVPEHLIVRSSWLFGERESPKFLDRLPYLLADEKQTVSANAVQTGSPTYLPDFVDGLAEAIAERRRGILHLSNAGCVTAYEIAVFLSDILGSGARIKAAQTDDFVAMARSGSEALASTTQGLRDWKDAYRAFLVDLGLAGNG